MREIDLDKITRDDLLEHKAIAQAFKDYLMDVLEYTDDEADFVVKNDFENPYDTPFIVQDFEGEYTIDGKDYEVRFCQTEFCAVGLFHLADVTPFEYYMFFDKADLKDDRVSTYRKAKKLYLF